MIWKRESRQFAQQKAGVDDSKSDFQKIKQRTEIEGKMIKRESRERLVKGKRRVADEKLSAESCHRCKRGRTNFEPKYCEG
jgi:threonine dehydrogenase-like Zn-dependent dehydrogenase